MQDISKPEPVRLRRHLSAIVNFTRYREDKLNSYIDSQDQLADVMDEAAQVSAERDEVVCWPQLLLSKAVLYISWVEAQTCACCRGKNTRGSQTSAVPSNR